MCIQIYTCGLGLGLVFEACGIGLGLKSCGLGLGLGLGACGIGLGLGSVGLDYNTGNEYEFPSPVQ